ncbi:unnamed protein product [Cylindrotheca closterium]|uniref:Calmodulin n=1 Tax=Cylindrotheca closterium TaxID=2856 RepID=A0AAD2FWT7_9STRA|nr:unnamed protein product [Cylindrotheca closterium]
MKQNSFRESPSPAHRSSSGAEGRWGGEDEMFVKTSSPRSPSKKQSSSARNSHSRNHTWTTRDTSRSKLFGMSDNHRQPPQQLANIKQQWNAQRDIPSGAVRNNRFLPKREPSPPTSPQLVHQKKQWDTTGIPRGSVSSKAFLMNNGEELLDEYRLSSPRRSQHFGGRRSLSSSGRDDAEARVYPFSPRISASASPVHLTKKQQTSQSADQQWNQSSLYGGFETSRPSPNSNCASPRKQFSDELEIQEGTKWRQHSSLSRYPVMDSSQMARTTEYSSSQMVHGQSSRTFEKNPTSEWEVHLPHLQNRVAPTNHTSEPFSGWKPSQEIRKGTVKDRVISPLGGTNTSSYCVSRAVPKLTKQAMAEEMDDDPWIIPPKAKANVSVGDWGHAVQSKSDDSEEWENPNTDWLQPNRAIDTADVKSELFESREEISSLLRDKDVVMTAASKKNLFDAFGQPLHDTNDRDMDIVMAAKRKGQGSSRVHDMLGSDNGFSAAFLDEDFEIQAFPDNPFESSFADLCEPNKLSDPEPPASSSGSSDGFEDTFYDAEPTFDDAPKEVETSYIVRTDAAPITQVGEPKRERKSIFNIFGSVRKDKDAKKTKPRFSFGSTNMGSRRTPTKAENDHRSRPPSKQMTDYTTEEQQKKSMNMGHRGADSHKSQSSKVNQKSVVQHRMESLTARKHHVTSGPFCAEDSQQIESGKRWEALVPSTSPTEVQDTERVTINSPKNTSTLNHPLTLQQDQLEQIYDGELSQKNPLCTERESTVSTASPDLQAQIERIADDRDNPNRKVQVVAQTDSTIETSPINGYESVHPDLNGLITGSSEDSDSVESRGLLNTGMVETQRPSKILPSGTDRKRKTEKLRRYGEVNSRFKESILHEINSSKPSHSHSRTLKNSRYTKEVQDRGIHFDPKPTNGSRHAKIKYNIAGSKVAKRHDLEDGPSTNKKRSKARNYARQRAGFMVGDVTHSNSSESVESVTLASVGSDIRVLRTILRRPRCPPVAEVSSQSRGGFPTFEEEILDPMQQAGLKMLSATIIPMQAQVRRFLAMRRALTRMWALIVIQAHTRRWIAEKHYRSTLQSAITIQAIVRGHLARDDLDFKHVCAIEIQRVMRGYMSTMKVYEDIYKITVIQSYVRMKQAVDTASWKMAHIVQLQSVFRGFLVRRRQEYQQICAIAIQANWRRFYHRLNYQFDLLDIIIAQSVLRKTMAKKKVEGIRRGRLDKAAAAIQSKWRQIRCTLLYVQDMADILVVQSTLRRYLARKRTRLIRDYWVIPAQAYARGYLGRRALEKHRAARKIQSAWRGFVSYADYMFCIADIVNVQKVARAWLARREANHARELNAAATTIQSACRVVLSKAQMSRVAEVREMEKLSRELAKREARAVTLIQTVVRGMQTQSAYIAFRAARRIQTFWRCRNLSNAYKYYRAAMTIQASFRGMKSRKETLILRGEILAATIIQSAWRGFVSYTDYIFTVSDIITVQRVFRGHMARRTKDGTKVQQALQKRRQKIAASTTIQKGVRGLLDQQRYWYTLGCTMQVQSWMRGRLVVLQFRREEKARVKLQSSARRFLARQEYVQRKFIFMLIQTAEQERSKKIEALVIQEQARNEVDDKRRHNAARIIQRFFMSVREEVDQLVRAAKRRKNWRKKKSSRRECGDENGADDLLEGAWLDAACDSNLENDPFLAQTIANIGSKLESRGSNKMIGVDGSRRSVGNCSNEDSSKSHQTSKKNLIPPSKSSTSTQNEFSKLTGSQTTFYRLPLARMRRMDSREMNEDLKLEEAFMDTKISNARKRRIAKKQTTTECKK